jgi:hypothetical protein
VSYDDPSSQDESAFTDSRRADKPSEESARHGPTGNGDSKPDAGVGADIAGLVTSTAAYFVAMRHRFAADVRESFVRVSVALAALVVTCALMVMTAVFLCVGIADGLSELLGGRLWAGDLLAALIAATLVWVAARYTIRQIRSAFDRRTVENHDQQRPAQS